MSQILIHKYLAELSRLKKASGSARESIVREAFKDLLKAWGKSQDLVFLAEYPLKTLTKSNIVVDGALLHHIRTPLGWWEAKDEADDLDVEIAAKFKKGCRVFYARRPEMETAEEKLAWLGAVSASQLSFEETSPDSKSNWLGPREDGSLLALADKEVKAGGSRFALFKLFAWGNSSNRDAWVYDFESQTAIAKAQWMCGAYSALQEQGDRSFPDSIKWSADLKTKFVAGRKVNFDRQLLVKAHWRPFARVHLYSEKVFNDRLTDNHHIAFGYSLNEANEVVMICGHPQIPFTVHAVDGLPDAGYSSRATQMFPRWVYDATGTRHDNITDWALKQFQQHYHPSKGRKPASLNKEAIFHYVYAVLHDPLYREKYAQNLKRDFPRVPLYGYTLAHFEQWSNWGTELMKLHIGYESVEPWPVTRSDTPDTKARAAKQAPKCVLKSLPDEGRIVVDGETTLSGIPPHAWAYRLGNRSALDWVLDQHKERKPKDPTIREKFDTYRFADHKEHVITLLSRVARVSVETVRIVEALKTGPR